nr:MAG TPA: hypothetical protein [Caudoviricetes sp.]
MVSACGSQILAYLCSVNKLQQLDVAAPRQNGTRPYG